MPLPDIALESLLSRCADLLAAQIGLRFQPEERQDNLAKTLAALAPELGCGDLPSCLERFLAKPPDRLRLEALASRLANGETYFFRDPGIFAALEQNILPLLIRERVAEGRRWLRIWSAGCSSGEEAYSIAIAVARVLPDLKHWDARILATDINPVALARADMAVYDRRSFRGAMPDPKEGYFFRGTDGRYLVAPRIRSLANFARLNLVTDSYPGDKPDTRAMDVIFCRHVLMYFQPERIQAVIDRLALCLADGGWLVVSPVETALVAAQELVPERLGGHILFRRRHVARLPPLAQSVPLPRLTAVAELPKESAGVSARRLADQGRLEEALVRCDQALAAHSLDPDCAYLRASILLEQGRTKDAEAALQRTLDLNPDLPQVDFVLGNLLAHQGRRREAECHYRNALASLNRKPAESILAGSEGLTAGRLREAIRSILQAAP